MTIDPISLEVLRYRLEAVGEEAGAAIERTAISTVVVESKDFGVMITDATGGLVVGAGITQTHFYAAQNAISATLARHGATVQAGDVYLANDPHNGGGLHPQDVFIMEPIFVDDKLTGWVAATAHMMDMGGMVPGSFAPAATECYQEAIRFPPVLLIRDGKELADIWAVLLNNIRLSHLVELDLRGLIAGCHVASSQMTEVIGQFGRDRYLSAIEELCSRSAREFRRRIAAIEDGVYQATGWNEWNDETYVVPCRLTVEGDKMTFDFEGASPQAPHFFNSKPFIIKSELAVEVANILGQDLPYNRGLFDVFDVVCPQGSVVNCDPPAPVGFGHVELSFNAVETAVRALMLAISASPESNARKYLTGPTGGSGSALHAWAGQGLSGQPDGWLMMDGGAVGAAASHDRDGSDLFGWMVSGGGAMELPDVEVTESWYPIQLAYRRVRRGSAGAGRFRSGAGAELAYDLAGSPAIYGTVFANRRRIPYPGMAGGYPGALTRLHIEKADGSVREISDHEQGYALLPGERFVAQMASSGGYGDPIDRDQAAVEADVAAQRLTVEDARAIYGVLIGDEEGSQQTRQEMLRQRLAAAEPGPEPMGGKMSIPQDAMPLYPGIVQVGDLAVSERSGAILARAPDHWTKGCPRVRRFLPAAEGVDVIAYLDPETGHLLIVDVVVDGLERSFDGGPRRWVLADGEKELAAAE